MDRGYAVILAMLAAYAVTGLWLYLRARGKGSPGDAAQRHG